MSNECLGDPRAELVRSKYFTLHPKPLERWLWQQGLPQAAERVFWVHWERGMRSGDWCSEVPIKQVARECCIDPSTVTRAYQLLKAKGLIRRQDPGRDANNPFQQATAITEVRLPRDLLIELSRSPNRPVTARSPQPDAQTSPAAQSMQAKPQEIRSATRVPLTREQSRHMWSRASETERTRFFAASRERATEFEVDSDSCLTAADQLELLAQLQDQALAKPSVAAIPSASRTQHKAGPRGLSVLELARARKRVGETVPAEVAPEVLRQVIWAAEEGALRRFEPALAINIAIKKIREGVWSKPNRMPPNWMLKAPVNAAPEQCSAA